MQDMLAEIAIVEETVADLDFERFVPDQQAVRAVLYSLSAGRAIGPRLSYTAVPRGWMA